MKSNLEIYEEESGKTDAQKKYKEALLKKLRMPPDERQRSTILRDDRQETSRQLMVALLNAAKVNVKDLPNWRWLDPEVGAIHGLPGLAGQVLMTNGILVIMERPDGIIFQAHYEWFIPYEKQPDLIVKARVKKPTTSRKQKVDISEFI
jgi:hypothetical protein